jgi:hypothetical protein
MSEITRHLRRRQCESQHFRVEHTDYWVVCKVPVGCVFTLFGFEVYTCEGDISISKHFWTPAEFNK